jgi:hypothetical protein
MASPAADAGAGHGRLESSRRNRSGRNGGRRDQASRREARALFCSLALALGCPSDAERAELGQVARLVENIDRLRHADNANKQPLLTALEGATCQSTDACALKDLCVEAYRLHQRALDAIATLKAHAERDSGPLDRSASERKALEFEAIEGDLVRAKGLSEQCAEDQVRVVRKRLM